MVELAELVGNRDTKEDNKRCATWGAMCVEFEGKGVVAALATYVRQVILKHRLF